MTDFYTRVVGLTETDRGEINVTAAPFAGLDLDMVFLSGEPRDHHQIALVGNPGRNVEQGGALLNQVSFRLDSLDTLRSRTEAVRAEGITGIAPISHGNAWSVYFPDPEGNTIEMFVDTPWYVHQPRADELDLTKTNDEIIAWTEASIRDEPSFTSAEEWRATIRQEDGHQNSRRRLAAQRVGRSTTRLLYSQRSSIAVGANGACRRWMRIHRRIQGGHTVADLDFDNDKTALLVCDMQNDQVGAVTKAGQIRNIIENNQKAIAGARKAGIPVMYVVANFRPGYPEAHPNNRFQQANKAAGRLLEGTEMAAVNDAVAPEDGDIIIRKRRVNAFYATDLDIVLKAQGIETIVLTGIADGGVISLHGPLCIRRRLPDCRPRRLHRRPERRIPRIPLWLRFPTPSRCG